MLSDAQYKLLTSQNSEITNASEQKIRIDEKADDMMNCLRIIARSQTVDQEFKDKVFSKDRITSLISNLTQYDTESTASQESNKQAIVLDLMEQCLRYFQDRYKEVFIKKELKTFQQFAEDIKEFTEKQIAETKAQELHKTRLSLQPPLLYPAETHWKAMCGPSAPRRRRPCPRSAPRRRRKTPSKSRHSRCRGSVGGTRGPGPATAD